MIKILQTRRKNVATIITAKYMYRMTQLNSNMQAEYNQLFPIEFGLPSL